MSDRHEAKPKAQHPANRGRGAVGDTDLITDDDNGRTRESGDRASDCEHERAAQIKDGYKRFGSDHGRPDGDVPRIADEPIKRHSANLWQHAISIARQQNGVEGAGLVRDQ